MTGKVKWFNEGKGFGFIVADDNTEVFAHYSEIKSDGYRTLVEGQSVEFDVESDVKGYKAVNINIL